MAFNIPITLTYTYEDGSTPQLEDTLHLYLTNNSGTIEVSRNGDNGLNNAWLTHTTYITTAQPPPSAPAARGRHLAPPVELGPSR